MCHTPCESCLFQAMCSLAFFACMRVGEIISTITTERGSLIQLHQLTQLVEANQAVITLKFTCLDLNIITIRDLFQLLLIVATISVLYKSSWITCLLRKREVGGGGRPGPLFRFADGSSVSRAIFIDKLSMVIKDCRLDPSRY